MADLAPPALSNLVIDCADPERLAEFWGELLGVGVEFRWNQYVNLERAEPGGPAITLQQVPEPKVTKNRMHLDLSTPDIDAHTTRAVELGATVVAEHEEDGVLIRVLADPEGNEFCLLRT